MRKIGFSLMLLIGAGLVLFLSAHDLLSAPPIEFAPSNVSPLIAPSATGEFLVSKVYAPFGFLAVPGDFNNDGKIDLATIDTDGLNLRLGNGDGTVQPPKLVLSNNVLDAAVGDFNEDGNLDLVVTTSTRIVLLLGNGKGSFPTRTTIFSGNAAGCNISNLLVADLNNDGHLDVVGPCAGVLLGHGNGTFQTPKPVALNLLRFAAADVNNDGNLDLLVPNGINVRVLLGNGDGTFQSPLNTSGPQNARSVAAADFNHDGNLDLVVGTGDPAFGGPFVLLGNGNGTFQAPQAFSAGLASTEDLLVGDFNSDGKVDVVTGGRESGLSILLGNGDGTLRAPVSYAAPGPAAAPGGAGPLALGDFNRDHKLDLVIPGAVLLGDNTGTFQAARTFPLFPPHHCCSGASAIASGDFNGDGNLDLVSANGFDNTISILLGKSDGTFGPATSTLSITGVNATAVAVGDFNHDGKADLAVINECNFAKCDGTQGSVDIFLGNGNGTFQLPLNTSLPGRPINLVTGDFNGDGKLDLAVGSIARNFFTVLLGNGNGTFQLPLTTPLSGRAAALVAGDFNNDGILDLAAGLTSNNVAILLGKGNGTFQPPSTLSTSTPPATMAAADFNHDGNLDLAVAFGPGSSGTPAAAVFFGNGDGTLAPATSLNISAQSIAVADFNADGNPDVALGLAGASLVTSVLLGNGDGTFQSAASFPDGAGAPVLVGDFNRDKAPDIVINNGSAVTMLLNTGGTRITLTSSANPSPQGQPVTFTANVSVSVAVSGKAKPSGSITFMDGAASLGTVPLNAGQASFTTSSLSKGTHSITALYSGDSNYNQRRSAGLKETIN